MLILDFIAAIGISFNSILVRLKDTLSESHGSLYCGFNSILVRLKGTSDAESTTCRNKFQFHTGSIKSNSNQNVPRVVLEFQFHTGSIKSLRPFLCCLNWINWYYPRRFLLTPQMYREDIFRKLIIAIAMIERVPR